MERLLQDLRFATRSLFRRPAFTVVAVLTLAIGVGANSAIFSVVDSVLLRPLPYPEPDRIVAIESFDTRAPDDPDGISLPDLEDLRATGAFETAVAYQSSSMVMTGGGASPEVVRSAIVDGPVLSVFGLRPHVGRELAAADVGPDSAPRVLLGHRFWKERLGSRVGVLGETIQLEGTSYEIVGVAAEGFEFPDAAQLWIPNTTDVEGCGRGCQLTRGIGRLSVDTDLDRANAQLEATGLALAAEYPENNRHKTFVATTLGERLVGGSKRGLLLLLGAVGIVLLISAANLASLQMARGTGRSGEMGLRHALGASRLRLVRLLLCETFVLAVLGGGVGVTLATVLRRWVVSLAPTDIPRLAESSVDLRVLGFGLALSVLVALVFSLQPAWRMARVASASRGASDGEDRGGVRTRTVLVTAEIALAVVLLVGAGLLLRTYGSLLRVDPGFEEENLAGWFVALQSEEYEDPLRVVQFYDRLREEVAAVPGVVSVSGALGRPFSGNSIGTGFVLTDQPAPAEGDEDSASVRVALPGYHELLGVPLRRGRHIGEADRAQGQRVAVVNEAWVRRYSPDRDPLGRTLQLQLSFGLDEPERTIVGVVADIKTRSLTEKPVPEVFVPQAQMASVWMGMLARLRPGAEPPWKEISSAVARVDPQLPLQSQSTMEESMRRLTGPTRFYVALLVSFAAVAVGLAVVGLYGVISYVVRARQRELAVRMAIGASSGRIVADVMRSGLRPVLAGALIGSLLALSGSRLLESLLYDVAAVDPTTYAAVAVLLVVLAGAALLGPAVRALRTSPAQTLRR